MTGGLPIHALEALANDETLPICAACGTQLSSAQDQYPRQFVPASGQKWTSWSELDKTRSNKVVADEEDGRISLIHTEPGFGINQTPILLETSNGSYIWDCAAYLSTHLITHLLNLRQPLKAIAISHPHFFATSLTWSRALGVPLYLCEADKEWFQRLDDIKDSDKVIWWTGTTELGPAVTLVQCGGHFPGSSILHWDRLSEPAPPADHLPDRPTPVSGIIFTADTLMVMPTQSQFTFIWSAPNMIPLRPKDVLTVVQRLDHLPFHQATSTWPGRFIRDDAKQVLKDSVTQHLAACGWMQEDGRLVPRV